MPITARSPVAIFGHVGVAICICGMQKEQDQTGWLEETWAALLYISLIGPSIQERTINFRRYVQLRPGSTHLQNDLVLKSIEYNPLPQESLLVPHKLEVRVYFHILLICKYICSPPTKSFLITLDAKPAISMK